MDMWALGQIALYVALLVTLVRAKKWGLYPLFSWLVFVSAIASIPRLDATWENPLIAAVGWGLSTGKDLCRIPAVLEAYLACVEHISSPKIRGAARARRTLWTAALGFAVVFALPFLFIEPQFNVPAIYQSLMKARDMLNALLGSGLLIVCGALWASEMTTGSWWNKLSMRHAVLLGLLCVSTAVSELIPAGAGEYDWWKMMLIGRSVFQYGLIAGWIWLNRRQKDARLVAPRAFARD